VKPIVIADVAPNGVFWTSTQEAPPHFRIADDSPFLEASPGRVYALHRGRIEVHDPETVVFVAEVAASFGQ
jgi:hypothetical protein